MATEYSIIYEVSFKEALVSMDVDIAEYPNIGSNSFRDHSTDDKDEVLVKQTCLYSPLFTNIVTDFKVNVNKMFRGLPSTSVNDESEQYMYPENEDSQADVFGDEDDELNLIEELVLRKDAKYYENRSLYSVKLEKIQVIVKNSSILANDIEFALSAPVRSSCVVRGVDDGINRDEDSLFISIKSNFLLLIRFYLVPRSFNDTSCDLALLNTAKKEQYIFKPFLVQWWRTSYSSTPSLDTSGYLLRAHNFGLVVVSASASDVFRVYYSRHTDMGIMFMPHYNVPVNGMILHGCFAEPLDNNLQDRRIIFLSMVLSKTRRLEMRIYCWTLEETLNQGLSKSVLPLDADTEIPIFIVPLKINNNFLLVTRSELVMISAHDILSATYDFKRTPFNGGFPTSYCRPSNSVLANEVYREEILITDDAGVIYSILVNDFDSIQIIPVFRVAEMISVFSLTNEGFHFRLLYGSDSGSNKEIVIPKVFDMNYLSNLKVPQIPCYSPAQVIKDFKNWAPVVDVLIIDAHQSKYLTNCSDQELWALTGSGKKTKLTQFRSGYSGRKITNAYELLRKCERIDLLYLQEKLYVCCSLPFETKVLEYDSRDGTFAQVEDFIIETSDQSLLIRNAPHKTDTIIQVTRRYLLISDLYGQEYTFKFSDKLVLLADISGTRLCLVSQTSSHPHSNILEVYNFEETSNGSQYENCEFFCFCRRNLDYEPSTLKIFGVYDKEFVAIGDYNGNIFIYSIKSEDLECVNKISLHDLNPYNSCDIHHQVFLVPHSICLLEGNNNMFLVGTKDGYYIHFELDPEDDLKCFKFLRLGDEPISFRTIPDDSKLLFLVSKRLWLLNLYESSYPTKVDFEEKHDRAIYEAVYLPIQKKRRFLREEDLSLLLVKEEGLALCSVFPFRGHCVKQIGLYDSYKKIIYLRYLSTFAIFGNSKDSQSRMKFIDRRLLKGIIHREFSKHREDESAIFKWNEIPTAVCVWSIKRNNKVSKRLLVGCALNGHNGSFKILNINKLQESGGDFRIDVSELTSFEHQEPITNILQVHSSILFSSGNCIYSTSYDTAEKKLRPISTLVSLTSDIVSLSLTKSDHVIVSTKLDSVFKLNLLVDSSNKEVLKLCAHDYSPKGLVNEAELGSRIIAADKLYSSILGMKAIKGSFVTDFSYKMNSIPRVYSSSFNSYWSEVGSSKSTIICVGVNGEITFLRSLLSSDKEMDDLSNSLRLGNHVGELIELLNERLNRPFIEKVTGKGLRSLNKPYFNFEENKGKLIDYDIEEISRICDVKVII